MAPLKKSFFFLFVAITTFSFSEESEEALSLSVIEQQAAQIENQLLQLEEKIASFEDTKTETQDSFLSQSATEKVAADPIVQEVITQREDANRTAAQEVAVSAPFSAKESAEAEAAVTEERSVFRIDLKQAFAGAPIIYSILIGMSTFSFALWFYSMFRIRKEMMAPEYLMLEVKNKLLVNQYDEAQKLLENSPHVLSKMLGSLIDMRRFGSTAMLEAMRSEGKRATVAYWQKLGLLSDIAVMAPMFGLLGTVLGMFYAFYDINRSIESITTLFDGLGISVGTTVAGLIVALFAMMFHSLAKFRLVRSLAIVENEAQRFVPLIHSKE